MSWEAHPFTSSFGLGGARAGTRRERGTASTLDHILLTSPCACASSSTAPSLPLVCRMAAQAMQEMMLSVAPVDAGDDQPLLLQHARTATKAAEIVRKHRFFWSEIMTRFATETTSLHDG